jgi:hypothetical protein
MKYLLDYNHLNEKYKETNKLKISKYNILFNKIKKDLNLNFYYISTFGTTIPVFYPIFDNLIKNQKIDKLSDSDIVLLIICAISIIVNENKETINKLKTIIYEKDLKNLLNKTILFITNANKIFIAIAKNSGKVLSTMLDMLSYTALYVPFLLGILDIVKAYNIGLDNFNSDITAQGIIISSSIGILSISFKHIINILLKKIKRFVSPKTIKENNNFYNLIN